LEQEALEMFKTLTRSFAEAKRNNRTALSTWFSELVAFVYYEHQFIGSDSALKIEVFELAFHLKSLSIAADKDVGESVLMEALQHSAAVDTYLYIWETLGDQEKHVYSWILCSDQACML
jgi:hypothetical protein